jgi:glycosyltransferase involved in cell wall biosynthesis
MVRILFLIRSLNPGGAERQLIELVRGMDKNRFQVRVATFYNGGKLRPELEEIPHTKVYSLKKSGRWDLIPFLHRLNQLLVREQSDVIYSYMDTANLFGLWAGKRHRARVVWGLRAGYKDFSQYDWTAGAVYRLSALSSRFADLVICNSWTASKVHPKHGYAKQNIAVVPNGIDVEKFKPDATAGQKLRDEWNLPSGKKVIGIVGRLDPVKGHTTFFKAARELSEKRPDVHFVCVGSGSAEYKAFLQEWVASQKLSRRVTWSDARLDMPAVYNALDILTSASSSESFPNVIGEAMACGLPCVVTDVGDSSRIVGDSGLVIPPGDTDALTAAWERLLDYSPQELSSLGVAARRRIETEFTLETMVRSTEQLLEGLVQRGESR